MPASLPRVFQGSETYPDVPLEGPAVTIGNFDGVHAGHQAILARAQSLGRQHQLPTTVLTFYPHPAGVVRPG
ncbi:MAG: hypothetical protein KC656_36115, partial [Myxococcales bacterium]|nr:hypothetical protein [Myxococcales bacterium]